MNRYQSPRRCAPVALGFPKGRNDQRAPPTANSILRAPSTAVSGPSIEWIKASGIAASVVGASARFLLCAHSGRRLPKLPVIRWRSMAAGLPAEGRFSVDGALTEFSLTSRAASG
jgi:hypothetical protein